MAQRAGYLFVQITNGWWDARWSPGIASIIMDGSGPAHVSDAIIDEIRSRERGGLVELPRRVPVVGEPVHIMRGPFRGHLALYEGMAPRERVIVLLTLLGGRQRVSLPRDDVRV